MEMSKRQRMLRVTRLGKRWVNRHDHDPYLAPDTRTVLVEGHAIPRHFTGGYQMDDGTSVEITVRMAGGVPIVERFEVIGRVVREGPTGSRMFAGVTPDQIRAAASELKHELGRVLAEWVPVVLLDDGNAGQSRDTQLQGNIRREIDSKLARRKITPDLLRDVADTYRNAPSIPRQAVIDRFNVPESTANRWIRAARDQGFLGEAPKPGVAGERSTK